MTDNSEQLTNVEKIKGEFGDVFTGVSCLEGEYNIEM